MNIDHRTRTTDEASLTMGHTQVSFEHTRSCPNAGLTIIRAQPGMDTLSLHLSLSQAELRELAQFLVAVEFEWRP